MTTIEMRNIDRNRHGNGLIARGYVRQPIGASALTESSIRGWSYGLGRGLSGVKAEGTTWSRFVSQEGGAQ
ncbi:MAG: hypothetical protein HQM03_05010 [Magnetococcales bacterium]|nr:hypothetical protein [Magnetococcales bacterium]